MNKNVQILSIEGKDLLTKYYKVNKHTMYKGSLDDSMEIDKLKTLGKKVIKYNNKNKRLHSDDIMTVTFKYACKNERDLTDEEYERLASLQIVLSLLSKKQKQEKEHTKELIKLAKREINKKEIREQLYNYGFNINVDGKNKHFVRYKRTSGSARVGKCLFINSKYEKEMIDWSFSGIKHKIGTEMDCAAMEAYISLPTSSAIDRFSLKPENILLIDDVYSEFEDTVMGTELIDHVKDNEGNIVKGDLHTDIITTKIKNNLFDGESLLDKSIFNEKHYEDKATLQIRNRFFKGIGINADIQQFFKDNNISKMSQLNGKSIATDISQIKLITTPSSVKYLKFGNFEDWLKMIEPEWAICKYEKPQKHFNGMVQTHYQLLNTLGMSKDEMEGFLQDTVDYINLLKSDVAVFKYHLGINSSVEKEDDVEIIEELNENIKSSNDFILNMLEINEDFEFTKTCKNYRNESVKSYMLNARKGHILVEGNYSVIVSCPYEYLQASIGKFDGTSQIKPFECVSSKFQNGERILAVRSPEPTMSNITIFTNTRNEYIEKYFNTNSKEVCYISPINNNIMELLSSCDFDGDSFFITNNKLLVECGERLQEKVNVCGKEIKRFLVSTDFTPKSSIKRKYTPKDLCDTDIKCSSNKIGEIINLAQMLNSLYWDKKFKGSTEEELLELYKDISNLNILSCIEIDRAKKISPVDAKKELDKIRKKHNLGRGKIIRNKQKKEVGVRPRFFKYLDGGKDYKFKRFNTGMDYLNDILDERIERKSDYTKDIPLTDLMLKENISQSERNSINKIKKIVTELRVSQQRVWMSCCENKYELSKNMYEKALSNIKSIKLTKGIIYQIFRRIDKANSSGVFNEYKKIGLPMIKILHDVDKILFFNSFKIIGKENIHIIKSNSGNIKIYGELFKKCQK